MKIVVTGALGVVGRGVGNAIRLSPKYRAAEVVGFDTMEMRLGTLSGVYDRVFKVPRCDAPEYAGELQQLLSSESPDAVIATPEIEFIKHCELGIPNELLAPLEFTNVAISKRRLMKTLEGTDFIPRTADVSVASKATIKTFMGETQGGAWLRAADANTTGGAAAKHCKTSEEVIDWIALNSTFSEFQLSEYLPGRNLACSMVYSKGRLVSAINALRLHYLLGHLVPSGVTGFCDYGKIFRDEDLVSRCVAAVERIPGHEKLSGAITVDLKEDACGLPKITEINLRYIGLVHVFALAGYNIVQDHIDCILGEPPTSVWSGPAREFHRGVDISPEVY